jgi:hypothetical protein
MFHQINHQNPFRLFPDDFQFIFRSLVVMYASLKIEPISNSGTHNGTEFKFKIPHPRFKKWFWEMFGHALGLSNDWGLCVRTVVL